MSSESGGNAGDDGQERADERIGSVVAERYRLIERLGEGGMGAVYRAEHIGLHKPVAVKFLHREAGEDPTMRVRFEREAMAAANLSHPNVAEAMDFGRLDDGTYYLAMELVQGPSLRAVLREGGALAPARAAHIAAQIASALARAHAMGVVHRDLKPENVVLRERDGDRDFVKVIDFGVARVRGPAFDARTGLTQVGTVVGTPAYMAPEQCMGQAVDGAADQYALGVMLFEMLTGQKPFSAEDTVDVLRMHVGAPVPSATGLHAELPRGVDAVLARMMAKRPGERFEGVEQAVEALRAALSGATSSASTAASAGEAVTVAGGRVPVVDRAAMNDAPRSRAPLFAGLALIALGALAAGVWWSTRPPAPLPLPTVPAPTAPVAEHTPAPAPLPPAAPVLPVAPDVVPAPAAPAENTASDASDVSAAPDIAAAPAAVIPTCEGNHCVCADRSTCSQVCTAPGCVGECRRVEQQCQLGCGEGCQLTCRDSRACVLRCADDCRAACLSSGDCSVECGEGCRVECRATGVCTVRMATGEVRCRQAGRCDVRCVGDDGQERAAAECERDVYRCPPEACGAR